MRSLYYTLDDERQPVHCPDLMQYHNWKDSMPESTNWYSGKTGLGFTIALDEVGGDRVSTVYLGIDHGFGINGNEGPILWETMVFPECDVCERYRTYGEAMEGHRRVVESLKVIHG